MSALVQEATYSTEEVMAQACISRRVLNYLVHCGVLTPSLHHGYGSGSRHLWSADDLAVIRVIVRLRALGIRNEQIRAEAIRAAIACGATRLAIHRSGLVFDVSDPLDLVAILRGSAMAWVVAVR